MVVRKGSYILMVTDIGLRHDLLGFFLMVTDIGLRHDLLGFFCLSCVRDIAMDEACFVVI